MKAFNTVVKIMTALAAVAGAVYVIATYGDKIVAWAQSLLEKYGRTGVHYFNGEEETDFVPAPAAPVTAEAPAEEAEEVPAAPVADETAVLEEDFEA